MGQYYSIDLRQRVIDFVDAGHSMRAAARHFSVSISFVVKLMQRRRRVGTARPARQGRPRGKGPLAAHLDYLLQQVEATPDITMPELAAELKRKHEINAAPSSLSRLLVRAGFSYKKNTDGIGTRARRC